MSTVSGSLITRNYTDFRGVDFTDENVSLTRSPDSLNMWKDYKKLGKCIETRPDIELVEAYDNTIFGLFFYRVGNTEMMLVHCGTTLYKVVNGVRETLYTGLNPKKSNAFIYNNIWYFKDGINYLQYDGKTIGEVVGFIPTTSISRSPSGGGTIYQDVNMLTGIRKNTFSADGKSTEYYLDAQNIDADFQPIVLVNNEQVTAFTVDTTKGLVKFATAPTEPLTVGQDNVSITFRRTIPGYRDRINKCTLLQVFDNRVFFSGNQDYPNTVWHCSLNDPTYCSDLDYYNEGLDLSPVKGMVAGNNALWVFKEPSQANTTVFYHNPVIDADYGKVYPSTHSNISTGCVGGAINFNDDICFFSDRGMEAITGDVTTEQVLSHRSSLIDSKLLSESNYKDMILEEWEGYLLVIIGKHIYLADSNASYQNHARYEWFYWELDKDITTTKVKDGVLYLCTTDGIYTMTNNSDTREVSSYWTTPYDEFKYPQYQKTTNKRGCVIDMAGAEIKVSVRTDGNSEIPSKVIEGETYYDAETEFPIEIKSVTGLQEITLTHNGITKNYEIDLGDIELHKIEKFQDYIYKKGDKWYKSKNIHKRVLNGNEDWGVSTAYEGFYRYYINIDDLCSSNTSGVAGINTHFTQRFLEPHGGYSYLYVQCSANGGTIYIQSDALTTATELKTWLSENNVTVYYALCEPIDEEITNSFLIDRLEAIISDIKFEDIDTYLNIKGYVVSRIKKKKWKAIQLKFSSNKSFQLYSNTLEAYVGGYVKR